MFHSPKQKYLAEEVVVHLSTLCRMYNDYGSVGRDREERKLNSINFPDFDVDHGPDATEGNVESGEMREKRRKGDLMALAEYERECLDHSLRRLEGEVDGAVMEKLRLFVNVTDLYGQIYVARDIGVRTN